MTDNQDETGDVWLSRDQQRDWASLVALIMTLPGKLDAQLKHEAGINFFEYNILVSLSDAPGHVRVMSDLAGLARGSLSRLSHAVSRLEGAGWVERRSCGGAGRRTEAILTETGWQELQRIAPSHVREVRRLVIDAMGADQLEHLGAAARLVVTAVDPALADTLASAIDRRPRG
ncbi:MarR family winged helix-turn-helix transcriptional regulator [Williamsia sp. 1135]|uniref:MarR family winged helix-turn-helix transcriptional regulator n=1 Tax=Williamsia sp. 1135 TaxID=1889262 RepID=UPI00197D3CD8|nr:MarR family winged helix-turn-helix transcriptional regulator [Williamsia sp. 1135]